MKTTQIIYDQPVQTTKLPDFIKSLSNILDTIPKEFKKDASIDFNIGQMPYEDWPYVFITIEYERDENDVEKELRLELWELDQSIIEQNERAMLKELKEKYE